MDFDITKSIKLIENLKCGLLSGTSDLFKSLAEGKHNTAEREKALADIVTCAYLLSGRLNISPKNLDEKITEKLRLKVLDSNDGLYNDYSKLLKHFDNI